MFSVKISVEEAVELREWLQQEILRLQDADRPGVRNRKRLRERRQKFLAFWERLERKMKHELAP